MENTKNKKSKLAVNYEKIGVYVACLGFIFLFWQSQMSMSDKLMTMSDKISDIKERIATLEVKVEKLEQKI